jgi:aminoglycoside phosphotransferase (APT) family kinase protein
LTGSTREGPDGAAGFAIDEGRLERYLRGAMPGFEGPVRIEKFAGGQSNPTYRLETPARRYVLRRKPPGPLLASAHAVDREFRVQQALGRVPGFPVAPVHVYCDDPEVIGTPFYVMDLVEGRVFWDATLPEVPRGERRRYYESMVGAIAALHSVDYVALGLADFGKPGDYFSRQISRWSRQYLEDGDAGRVAAMDRLIEWLPRHIPPGQDASIVHGDYRCDNIIFHPTEPRVLAVLDWELSTIGHPLADFGYHLLAWRMPPLGVTGMLGQDLEALGIPGEAEYVAMYCERTGRAGIPGLDFYAAFNMFRLAAIFHGIRGRMLRGNAVSARAREYAAAVEQVAELGWLQAEKMGLP